jgi:hypothetical protein
MIYYYNILLRLGYAANDAVRVRQAGDDDARDDFVVVFINPRRLRRLDARPRE